MEQNRYDYIKFLNCYVAKEAFLPRLEVDEISLKKFLISLASVSS